MIKIKKISWACFRICLPKWHSQFSPKLAWIGCAPCSKIFSIIIRKFEFINFSRTLNDISFFFAMNSVGTLSHRESKRLSNFSCRFLNPNFFSNLYHNCSTSLDLRNLQEQVKKAFCYQKLF